ncbi:MAG: DNA repair helicase XPB [Bullifex sp.]
MEDKPLFIQSDRTILLDVHSPYAEAARSAIIPFAELIRSPEHIHTYALSSLSIWNAASVGLTYETIAGSLEKYSRFEIPSSVLWFIKDSLDRYGAVVLSPYDELHYQVRINSQVFRNQILCSKAVRNLIEPCTESSYLINKYYRGEFKIQLIKLGFPVEDLVPLKKGPYLEMEERSDVFSPRPYQKEAVDAFLGDGGAGKGYGNIILPCGSGKTVVAIHAMCRLKTDTLILCPNVTSVHQWKRELIAKTTLTEEMVGEYSGDVKEVKPVTIATYQIMIYRQADSEEYKHFSLLRDNPWGFVVYDEVHMLPAACFKVTAEIQSVYRLGLTATLVREDHREAEVFSLVGPKRYDTPWSELEKQGFIATAHCHEIRVPLSDESALEYAKARGNAGRYRVAAENPFKFTVLEKLLEKHEGDRILIIAQYLDQLDEVKKRFGFPMITGSTSNKRRDELYDDFRSGKESVLIVSKVANYAIDLPDASVAIQLSGSFGSRQEEAQRLGRILRPKEKDSHFYTIVTKYTSEEDFAQNRQKFLAEQGYSYEIETWDE